jgi:hypothetical protein
MYPERAMFAREGVELDRSILARWVGEVAKLQHCLSRWPKL